MKKILYNICFFLALLVLITGCKKDSFTPATGEKPEERMNEALAEYKDALISHEYGWKAYLYADGGVGAGFYMQFADDDRVKMLADLTEESLEDFHESGYRIKAVMAPSLIFDTDNYIHLLANPDNSEFGGQPGVGYGSDFEFEFRGNSNDTLQLLGKKRKSKFLLVKATKEEQTAYLDGTFKKNVYAMEDYVSENAFLYITPDGDEKVQVSINPNMRETSLTWVESGSVKTVKQPYAYSVNGVHIKDTLAYKDTYIQEIIWKDGFKAVAFDGTEYELFVSPTPILPLHLLMGVGYSAIVVPVNLGEGVSSSFAAMHSTLKTVLNTGTYFLLGDISFNFNTINQRMTIRAIMPQTVGGSNFVHTFNFSYEKNESGQYTFTYIGNADYGDYTEARFKPLIDKLTSSSYELDFFTTSSGLLLGKFINTSDSEFYFSGRLQ